MKIILSIMIVLFFQSCCSPHFVGYINPLYLEPDGYEVSCMLRPCRDGEKCSNLPWFNSEFEYSNVKTGKVGFSYFGYTDYTMLSFTTNFVSNFTSKNSMKGIGFETQLGSLPINKFFTTFAGLEYNRLWSLTATHQFHPTIGFAAPFKFANAFQIKGGYQYNHNTPNFWTVGLNLKTPLLHYFIR